MNKMLSKRQFVQLACLSLSIGCIDDTNDKPAGSIWRATHTDSEFRYRVVGYLRDKWPIVEVIKNDSHLGLPVGDTGPISDDALDRMFERIA